MPPTDKALAVMTEIDALTIETLCIMPLLGVNTRAELERRILPLVRYLVDHPERLAGEDEVVVKRGELSGIVNDLQHHGYAEDSELVTRIEGWLAGSPTAQDSK